MSISYNLGGSSFAYFSFKKSKRNFFQKSGKNFLYLIYYCAFVTEFGLDCGDVDGMRVGICLFCY